MESVTYYFYMQELEMSVVKSDSVRSRIKFALSSVCVVSCVLFTPVAPSVAKAADISLPNPQMEAGMSVMQALAKRQTSRSFSGEELTPSQLSHILWAANGVNRPDSDGRTNPAALGVHSVEVYAVTAEGIFLYQPQTHTLQSIAEGDFRMTTTTGQPFVGEAPLNLVYVGNSAAWENAGRGPSGEKQVLFDSIAAGTMAQSVALVAAAEGIGTCVRASVDHAAFSEAAHLQDGQTILLAQTLGVLP